MQIKKLRDIQVDDIVSILKNKGLVILPTETVYGAMVDATNQRAVQKLTAYKNRPLGKPYSIAVTDLTMAQKYVSVNDIAKALYEKYLPGPLTIVSKGKGRVASGIESELGTLGIRIPDYKLVLEIIKVFGKPITATSANASYKRRPYKISDILDNLSTKQKSLIDLIVDAGKLPHNEPSTVIDTTLDDPVVLRQGEIQFKDKIKVLSRSEENTKNIAKELWQKYEHFFGKRALVFALQGEMGTGKTQFSKGLALAMGIKDNIVSPTFILESEYEIPHSDHKFLHIDTWRIQNSDELLALGFEKNIINKHVLAIEWADKTTDIIREFEEEAIIIWVKIEYGKKDTERLISWAAL